MSQRHDLPLELRSTGKASSRKLRTLRKVPGVLYGSLKENRNVVLDENVIKKFSGRAYENALFNIQSNDANMKNVVVLLKAVQVHPVTRRPEHVDLFALDLKKTVRVSVEIRTEGKPAGTSEGGLLNIVNRQIEIECLPTEIPEFFTADVSALGVGDSLHVSDLKLPENIKLISSADLTIAVVNLVEEESLVATSTADATASAAAAAAAAPAAGVATGAPSAPGAAPAAAAPAAGKDKK